MTTTRNAQRAQAPTDRSVERRKLIDDLKSRNSILEVAVELNAISQSNIRQGSYLGPCFAGHPSTGNKCLSISNANGLFNCFNCGVSGDVIALTQLHRFGVVNAESFKKSIHFLAGRVGLIIPEAHGSRLDDHVDDWRETRIGFQVLSAAAEFFHSQLRPQDKDYLNKRGISDETITKLKIGFSSGGDLLTRLKSVGFSEPDALSSGLFYLQPPPVEIFVGRLVIPYFVGKEVRYMIGRETEQTPESERGNHSKYKKLPCRKEGRTYIAPGIKNNVIFNQDVITKANEIVITEGVLDCVTLAQNNIPSISPVTVRFSKSDIVNVVRLLRKDQRIYIANDNEDNAVGEKGATDMAIFLSQKGFMVKIITLPLLETHRNARKQLRDIENETKESLKT